MLSLERIQMVKLINMVEQEEADAYPLWDYLKYVYGRKVQDDLTGVCLTTIELDLDLPPGTFMDLLMRMFDKGELTNLRYQGVTFTVDTP